MSTIRTSLIIAALGFAALASSPARANLIISCSGSGCSGTLNSISTNTIVTACGAGCTFGDFTIGPLAIVGQLDAAGNLADTENLDVSATGSGSITLDFTETNLTAGSAQKFIMDFTGLLSGALTVTRSFYLDPLNGGGTSILLGSCVNAGGCSSITSALQSLSGQFSLTEQITLTATGSGLLSSDDDIKIPEPATLSLFGGGLLALGAFARRRRKASKQV